MIFKPTVLAMVPCEKIDRPSLSSHCTLNIVLWNRSYDRFPVPADPLWVYIALTEIHGRVDMALRLWAADGQGRRIHCPVTAEAQTPADNREISLDIGNWEFSHPGIWFLDLELDSDVLVSRRLKVERTV